MVYVSVKTVVTPHFYQGALYIYLYTFIETHIEKVKSSGRAENTKLLILILDRTGLLK